MSDSSLTPEIIAYRLYLPGFRAGVPQQVAFRCDWCEEVHFLGAVGGGFCSVPCGEHSPLRVSGVKLTILDYVGDGVDAFPPAPMGRAWQLRIRMILASVALQRIAAKFICGSQRMTDFLEKRIGPFTLTVFAFGWRWSLRHSKRAPIEGRGLLTLAAALYGVSPGVAAVRILEVFNFRSFDPQTALAIQGAVDADAWAASSDRRAQE
jgi:hypothetical protein